MTQTLKPANTTKVLAIEELGSNCVKAIVEDLEDEELFVEHSCTYSVHGFRLLDGAEAALKVFQEKKTDDEKDGTFVNCLESVLSYIMLCFTGIVDRIDSVLQCKPNTSDTQRPASRHDDIKKNPQGLDELILHPSQDGYQCRKSGCEASFTFSEVCMFHEEKHHQMPYYKSSGDIADTSYTSSDTDKSIRSSTALIRRPSSSNSVQTLVPSRDLSSNTEAQPLSQLLPPLFESTHFYKHFKMSRCFIIRVLAAADGVYVQLLAGKTTKEGIRLVRLREMQWEALDNDWGIQLKEHIGEKAYEKATSKLRVETGTSVPIFAAQQTARDVGLTPKQCSLLLKENSLFFSERTDILNIPWISSSRKTQSLSVSEFL